jgi:hypothetical protein
MRAQDRAGGGRINAEHWFPEIEAMEVQGMNQDEIAKAINLSTRRIREIKQEASEDGTALIRVLPSATAYDLLDQHYKDQMEFTPRAFKSFFEEFSGHMLGLHQEEWIQHFIDHRTLMINIPPRHGKSTFFSVWLPIWLIVRNRDEQILLVSKTRSQASKFAGTIARELEHNYDLVRVFGRFAPDKRGDTAWRPLSGELTVLGRTREAKSGEFTVQSRGSGQQVLGTESTVVIVDDATDGSMARSDTQREEQIRWLREEVLSRIEPEAEGTASGRAVIVGQRVHFKDMYGEIAGLQYQRGPKKGERLWTTIVNSAIVRWPEEDPEYPEPKVLWPEKWTYDELIHHYELSGHAAFECMYQQNPVPEDSTLVNPEWWVACRDYERAGYEGYRKDADAFVPVVRVMSIDPGDRMFNGLIVADVPYSRDQFNAAILEVKHWKGGTRDFIAEVDRCLRMYKPDYFIIEQHMGSRWLFDDPYFEQIKSKTRVIGHNTNRNKGDGEMGVASLAVDIEMARVRLPYGDVNGREMSGLLEAEGNIWPFGDHDDMLMALWFIKWNYKRLIPMAALPTKFRKASGNHTWRYVKAAKKNSRRV